MRFVIIIAAFVAALFYVRLLIAWAAELGKASQLSIRRGAFRNKQLIKLDSDVLDLHPERSTIGELE